MAGVGHAGFQHVQPFDLERDRRCHKAYFPLTIEISMQVRQVSIYMVKMGNIAVGRTSFGRQVLELYGRLTIQELLFYGVLCTGKSVSLILESKMYPTRERNQLLSEEQNLKVCVREIWRF